MKRNCVCITSEHIQRPGVSVLLHGRIGVVSADALDWWGAPGPAVTGMSVSAFNVLGKNT